MRERAAQTLEWATRHGGLLDLALDHLSLGRAHILAAQRDADGDLAQATARLGASVDGHRRAGPQHNLPLGLLTRAALHTHTRAFDLARDDLAEALDLAERCGFRLHECDAHLGHARLCLAEGDPVAALDHLAKARAILEDTGYHRRDGELADLEAEARAMPPPDHPRPPPVALAQPAPVATPPRSTAEPMPSNVSLPQPVLDAYRDRKLAVLFGSGRDRAGRHRTTTPDRASGPGLLLDQAQTHGALQREA